MQRSRIARFATISMVACLLAVPAWAEDEEDLPYAESGLYLSAGANFQFMTRKDDIETDVERSVLGAGSANAHDSWGLNTRLGYRVNPRVAVETQFEFLTNVEVDLNVPGGELTEKISLFTWTGNAKYIFLTGRIQPYLVAGAGWGQSKVRPARGGSSNRSNGWVARGGAGVNLYGSRDIALTLETSYVHPASGGIEDLDYISFNAGLMLLFYGLD